MDPVKREPTTAEERVPSAPVHAERARAGAEQVQADQVHAEPVHAELGDAELVHAERAHADLMAEVVSADTRDTELASAESLTTETDSAETDTTETDSTETDSTETDSTETDTTKAGRGDAPVVPGTGSASGMREWRPGYRAAANPRPYAGMVRIPRSAARLIVSLFVVVHAVLAFGEADWSRGQLHTIVGFVSVAVAGVWLGLSKPDVLPWPRTLSILGLCGLTAVVMSLKVSPLAPEPFAHWHLGAITIVLVVLAVRGRLAAAWIAYGAMALVTVLWAISEGLTVFDGLAFASRHAATLLAATLFAVGLRRSAAKLKVLHREGTERAVADATSIAAVEEREAHLARVNGLARPTLSLLARSYELDDEMRAECLLVEATLRDAIRGRSLFQGPVIPAARAARLRGVEVALLDDCGDQPPAELAAVVASVAGELSLLNSGRFTARVLPADRPNIATIVVEGAEHRILVITPSGEVRDG